MLSTPAPYPFPGSQAFLVRTAEPCRILQRRGDGRLLISLTHVSANAPDIATIASGNRTVGPDELAATQEEALGLDKPRRRRRSARGSRQ